MTTTRIGKNRTYQWFQTFPQWEAVGKEKIYDDLLKPLGVDFAIVAEETHEDGGIHYHAAYKLKLKKTKPQLVKYYKNKLPDAYLRCTVMRALEPYTDENHVTNYLGKEDPNPFIYDQRPHPCDARSRELGCDNYEALRREVAPAIAREQLVRDALEKYDRDFQHVDLPDKIYTMFEFFRKHDSLVFHDVRYGDGAMAQFIAVCKTILQ